MICSVKPFLVVTDDLDCSVSNLAKRSFKSVEKIQVVTRPHAFLGYVFGFRQPVLRYSVQVPLGDELGLSALDRLLSQELGTDFESRGGQNIGAVETHLMHWTRVLLEKAAHPVFEAARLLAHESRPAYISTIAQPCLNHTATLLVVNHLIKNINLFADNHDALAAELAGEIISGLSQLLEDLALTGLQGFNQLHFLKAAFELGVPWASIGSKVFQLGFGSAARWIDSSFTDATPYLSMQMARNKALGALVLRTGGLPVPPHIVVNSDEVAVQSAEKLGYPVVVKPVDLDGGKGVKANLRTAASVRKAFSAASELSKHILVEKHVPGRDYRIQVVNGEIHGVLERVPGGVTGNALDSVRGLLTKQNQERKFAQDDRRYLHQMAFDDEAEEQLSAQGMDWDTVPAEGYFVRLRGASNVASGGVPVPVPLAEVHPDNLGLAVRAARVLRLDVAGIDLLIPDIRNSWLETGAHICEVNAQPQMFSTLHKPMVLSLLNGGDGRIPVVVIIGGKSTNGDIGIVLHRELLAAGVSAGLVSEEGVWVGPACVSRKSSDTFSKARMLCFDSAVQVMVICVDDDSVVSLGWPVDHCDVLIVKSEGALATNVNGDCLPTEGLKLAAALAPGLVIIDKLYAENAKITEAIFSNSAEIRFSDMSADLDLCGVAVMAMLQMSIHCDQPC